MKEDLLTVIKIPEGVQVDRKDHMVTVKGAQGENTRKLFDTRISIEVKGDEVHIASKKGTKREKTNMGTFAAHMRNLIKGVQEPFVYTLKICSGHFPMNVSVADNTLSVKNFLGEKIPRTLTIEKGVDVNVAGSDITVTSANKELAGQTAANIERLTRITNKDRRIFQDGIYITNKAGKEIK